MELQEEEKRMAKVITIFFSMKGETIAPGMKIVKLDKGNTAWVAEYIHEAVGGALFELETVKTYIEDHMKMIYEAKEELEKGIRPELKAFPEDFDRYDTVFLGFPNWWATLPMPVVTFLEGESWQGKRVIPFVTSEGSGFAGSIRDLKKYCPGAVVEEDGLAVIGHEAEASREAVAAWARRMLG